MKTPSIILLALSLHVLADPVDASRDTYEAKLRQGTLALNTRTSPSSSASRPTP